MADLLAPEGYVETAAPEDADLIVLNTCHIREKAAEKVYSELGRVRAMKEAAARKGRHVTVAVAGCVAQAEGEEIIRRAPVVDLVVGPQSYHRLPELLAREGRVVATEFPVEDKFSFLPAPSLEKTRSRGVTAFVTVQEGCDKFCTFCVVPYTRGAEVSRPVGTILSEVQNLAAAGVREVTLIGQNVNAYHGEGFGRTWTLGQLLHRVAEIPGIARLRYTTSHPRDVDDDLIAVHRDLPQLAPQLHLPVQSGSDRMLDAMNRRHTRADYLGVIERLRAARADLALTSDFIVGFPGETEDDFRDTLRLVDEVGYSGAFSFKYSQRPGTPGATMHDQIADEVKSERLARLQAAINRNAAAFNARCRGLHLRRADGKARPAPWPTHRPLAISPAGPGDGAGTPDRPDGCGNDHGYRNQQPVRNARRQPQNRCRIRRRPKSRRRRSLTHCAICRLTTEPSRPPPRRTPRPPRRC